MSVEAQVQRAGQLLPESGSPWPMGASCTGRGVNFAVFSEHASKVAVCVFGADGRHEIARHELPEHTNGVWHGHLPGAGEGLVYGGQNDTLVISAGTSRGLMPGHLLSAQKPDDLVLDLVAAHLRCDCTP